MFASGSSWRTRRQTSGPSISGIIQSRIASVGSVATPQAIPRLRAVADERRAVVPALQRAGEDLAGHAIVFRDQHVHVARKYTLFTAFTCRWSSLNGRCTIGRPTMSRSTLKRLGIAVLCGLVGLALNIWRHGAIAPLLLGRIVTLPVAILFGPWFGALAALIHARWPDAASSRSDSSCCRSKRSWSAPSRGAAVRRCSAALIVWTAVAATLDRGAEPLRHRLSARRRSCPSRCSSSSSGLVAVVVADLLATGAAAQRLVDADAAARRAGSAATRFTRSCSPRRCRSCVLGVGRQPADVGQAGSRRRRPPARGGDGAQPAHRRLRQRPRARRAVARRGARRRCRRRRAAASSCSTHYHDVYPGFITLFVADRLGVGARDLSAARLASRRRSATASTSSTPCRPGSSRSPTSSSGRLSYVPIVTIAVPIFDDAGAGRRRRGRLARPVEVRALRRGLPHAARRAHHRPRSARRVILHERQDRASPRCRASRRTISCSASAPARQRRVPVPAEDRRTPTTSAQLAASATMAPTGWKVFVEQPLVNIRLQSTGYYAFTLALMLLALRRRGARRRARSPARSRGRSRRSSTSCATSRRTAATPRPR